MLYKTSVPTSRFSSQSGWIDLLCGFSKPIHQSFSLEILMKVIISQNFPTYNLLTIELLLSWYPLHQRSKDLESTLAIRIILDNDLSACQIISQRTPYSRLQTLQTIERRSSGLFMIASIQVGKTQQVHERKLGPWWDFLA